MQQNVGALDSTIRIGLGFGLVIAGFLLKAPASWIAFAAVLPLLISGFAGKCPLYSLLGVTTCPAD